MLSVDDKPVADEDGCASASRPLPVGATAKLGIWRAGEPMDLDIRLLAPPETPPRKVTQLKIGGPSSASPSPTCRRRWPTSCIPTMSRASSSWTCRGGSGHMRLLAGDELLDLNGQAIGDVAQLQLLLPRLAAPWRATIRRDGRTLHLAAN